jgi:hypothetical protein
MMDRREIGIDFRFGGSPSVSVWMLIVDDGDVVVVEDDGDAVTRSRT